MPRVLHPLVAPLLEGVVVGDCAFPERGLVVGERMRCAKEMLARPDLPERVERKRIVVDRKAAHPDMQRGAEIGVHHELLVAHREAALEPAGGMQDEIRAALDRRQHRHRAFLHRLPVGNLRRGERAGTAQAAARAGARAARRPASPAPAPACRRSASRSAARSRTGNCRRSTGAPGRSSWVSAQPAIVSASAWAIAPALVTGPIAPPRMNGTTTAHWLARA